MRFGFLLLILTFSVKLFSGEAIKIRQPKMDHEGVYYFLTNLFGPQSKSVVKKNILLRPSLWGGPCDPYGQVYKNQDGKIQITDEERQCPDEGPSSKLDYYIERDVLAIVLLEKTCAELVNKEDTFKYFLKNLNITELNEINMKVVFGAFFPSKAINQKWLNEAKLEKNWNNVILSLCRTPTWQLL